MMVLRRRTFNNVEINSILFFAKQRALHRVLADDNSD